jgi:hypothetical protein
MKKTLLTATLAGVALLQITGLQAQSAAPAPAPAATSSQDSADQNIKLLREDLRSHKKQLVAVNLNLTETEATKFWPVYDKYSAETAKLGDERQALIKEYAEGFGKVTDEQALSLTKRSIALEEKVAQLRAKYVPLVNKAIPGTKTATFFQIDRRISNLIDLQLAREIPLVQDQK